jgi:protein phosphatase
LQVGDVFLLCSDGLSNQVKDDEIGMALDVLPPNEAVQALVDLACLRGGPDNITVVLVRVLGPQVVGGSDDAADEATPVKLRPIHPLLWTLLGVSSLASAWMFMLQRTEIALACLLGAIGAAAAAMLQRYGGRRNDAPDTRRFGRGPYVVAESRVTHELLSRLSEIIRQLRDAAMSENWRVKWSEFDDLLARAGAAAAANNLPEAARCQLRAISSIMAQLRRRGQDFGDSGVLI